MVFERLGSSHKDRYKNLSGARAKNLLRAVIYDKITTISVATNKDFGEGHIMGLLAKDANQAEELFKLTTGAVHMVINISVTCCYLSYFFGPSFVLAAALAGVVLVIN